MFTYKEIIDMAIGTPESGHVNFYALHVLLSNIAQRLDLLDEVVEYDEVFISNLKLPSNLLDRSSRYRLYAGADTEQAPADEQVPVQDAAHIVEEPKTIHEVTEVPSEEMAQEKTDIPVTANSSVAAADNVFKSTTGMTNAVNMATNIETGAVPAVSLQPSGADVQPTSLTKMGSIAKVDSSVPLRQLSHMEMQITQQLMTNFDEMSCKMKMALEQLNNVTHLLLDRKSDPVRVKQLRELAIQLHDILHPDEELKSWTSQEQILEEVETEVEEVMELPSSAIKDVFKKEEEEESLQLDQHLCYTTERMLNELLELKSDFCALTNKVNELAASLLKQDCQHIMQMMQDLQDQLRDIKLTNSATHEAFDNMTTKVSNAIIEIGQIKKAIINLDDVKIDKSEVEILLAEKADFQQLQTKVSIEQLDEFKTRLEKQFCEVRAIMNVNEKNVLHIIDNLRATLGLDVLELNLKDFRDVIEKRVTMLAESLQRYMDMTNDDCAAAAGRVKVVQDLACLSCDTPCVMRSVERSKVAKLPSAKASTSLGPIVTYELGSIRKSGVMGYYHKDEFPHAPSAWLNNSKAPMSSCVPRHAGGEHTVHTAEEHMQKVVLSKRNAGWTK